MFYSLDWLSILIKCLENKTPISSKFTVSPSNAFPLSLTSTKLPHNLPMSTRPQLKYS